MGTSAGTLCPEGSATLPYAEVAEIPGVTDVGLVLFGSGIGVYGVGGLFGGEAGGGLYVNISSMLVCSQ